MKDGSTKKEATNKCKKKNIIRDKK